VLCICSGPGCRYRTGASQARVIFSLSTRGGDPHSARPASPVPPLRGCLCINRGRGALTCVPAVIILHCSSLPHPRHCVPRVRSFVSAVCVLAGVHTRARLPVYLLPSSPPHTLHSGWLACSHLPALFALPLCSLACSAVHSSLPVPLLSVPTCLCTAGTLCGAFCPLHLVSALLYLVGCSVRLCSRLRVDSLLALSRRSSP